MNIFKIAVLFLSFFCMIMCSPQIHAQDKEQIREKDETVEAEEPPPNIPFSENAVLNSLDTLILSKDSSTNEEVLSEENNIAKQEEFSYNSLNPKRVAFYSALIPGMGQFKNKQYWKMPIVYVGLGVATYFVIDNQKEYNYYRQIYAGRMSNKAEAFEEMPEYSMETLRRARDFYRRNMEISVILGVVAYGVQILDALIFAHLKDFDISDDLSFRIKSSNLNQKGIGLGIALSF